MSDAIDHPRILAEIDEEVRRRRESGELPAGFERELDLVFSRFAPVHAIGDDFAQVLERAEHYTFIDVLAPVESASPVVPYVKRAIRKAVGWEVRYVAEQVSAFAGAVSRAVRLLGERVDALEPAAPAARGRLLAMARSSAPALDAAQWGPVVVDALGEVGGRVVHAESGDGALLAHLRQAGLDAYGVDPVDRAAPAGLEVRLDDAVTHLRAVPDHSLGAVILSTCVDLLPLATLVELAELARAKVVPGGVAVVVSARPDVWPEVAPVAADVAPGMPLGPRTWAELLGAGGLSTIEIVDGPHAAAGPSATYAVVVRYPS